MLLPKNAASIRAKLPKTLFASESFIFFFHGLTDQFTNSRPFGPGEAFLYSTTAISSSIVWLCVMHLNPGWRHAAFNFRLVIDNHIAKNNRFILGDDRLLDPEVT